MLKKIIYTKQLANALSMTPRSISTTVWQIKRGIAPADRLPRMMSVPGSRACWYEEDVQNWLQKFRPEPQQEEAKKAPSARAAGRPRKTEMPQVRLF